MERLKLKSSRKNFKLKTFGLLLASSVLLTACEEAADNTYIIKDVTVDKKESESEYRTTDHFILITKGERKARIETDEDDFERIVEGQHIDVKIDNDTGYLDSYQINMDVTQKVQDKKTNDIKEIENKEVQIKDEKNEN